MLSLSRKGLLSVVVICVLLSSGLGVYAGYYAGVHGPSPNPNPSQIGDVWTGKDIYYTGDLYQGAGGTALTNAITTKEASYVVWASGGTYYALNGATGAIDYQGTDADILIQSVLDTLTTGGVIDIKEETYTLSTGLTVYANTWIRGQGRGQTILSYTGTGYAIKCKSQATVQNNVKITDLDIHVTGANAGGIDFKAVSNGVIRDCYIANTNTVGMETNTSRKGINLVQSTDTAGGYFNLIEQVSLWNWFCGIYNFDGNVMTAVAVDCHNNYIGIYLENPAQCTIINPDLEGNTYGIDMASHYDNSLFGGYFELNSGVDILLPSAFGVFHVYGLPPPPAVTFYITPGAKIVGYGELISTTLLDHCTSGPYSSLTVGVSVTIGQVLFVNNTDGLLWKADATDNTTIPCVVIATTSITAGNAGYVLNQGYFRDNSWGWAPGGILYLSETAGAMTQTPPAGTGKQVQVLGYALTADIIYFDPNFMVLELS